MTSQRENLYHFLARLYRTEVDQPLLEAMRDLRFPAASGDVALDTGYSQLACACANCGDDTLNELAVDYARVFLGAGTSGNRAAFPYESVYTSPKKIVMQEARDQVVVLFAKQGLCKDPGTSDFPEDHLALLLEFMACQGENWPGQLEFLDHHLLNWVPAFAADLEKYAATDFYQSLGKITCAFLRLDRAWLVGLIAA